jgi:hypothetical protein
MDLDNARKDRKSKFHQHLGGDMRKSLLIICVGLLAVVGASQSYAGNANGGGAGMTPHRIVVLITAEESRLLFIRPWFWLME